MTPDPDGDFSEYASTRFASLVRSAIVLGCTLDEVMTSPKQRCCAAALAGGKFSGRTTGTPTCTGSC